jgi:D-alanyl-lipoteichoic acid acyltransferase DltB (MBOAT superfamily)
LFPRRSYFAANPREFWQRWHISLSTWLRDYLYIPLGGNRGGTSAMYRNLALTMLIGGLWHGAKWTFVAWGAYQGALLIVHRLFQPLLAKVPEVKGAAGEAWKALRIVFFFHLVCLGWLLFRAVSFTQAAGMFRSLLSLPLGLRFDLVSRAMLVELLFFTLALAVIEAFQHAKDDLTLVARSAFSVRLCVVIVLAFLFLAFGQFGAREFIYFQF